MEDVRKLYEERQMEALEKLCTEKEEAKEADFDVFACHAYAQAARNDLSRLSLESGIELFGKAAALCEGDEEKKKELYENFTKEVLGQLDKAKEVFEGTSPTAETVQSYRDCMRLSADALEAAAKLGDDVADLNTLEVKKKAVLCMVRLCAVYRYEKDMGKNVIKKTDYAPDDVRKAYNEKYDQLVADIRASQPDYTPEEIQREREMPSAAEEKKEAAKDGATKKKSLIDRILDLF